MFDFRLRFEREKKEFKEHEIAKMLGISKSRYCHYENEIDVIPIKYLFKLSSFYNVSLDYLFGFNTARNYSNSVISNFKNAGLRLYDLRKHLNLTQKELAKILHYSYTTISNYENDKNIISTSFLYDICRKYNISADYLLGRIDSPKYLN